MKETKAHEIVADVRRVTGDIGHVPSRVEYQRHGKFPGALITELFGSYALMLRASGLEYTRGKRDKQDLRKQHFESVMREADVKRLPVPPKISSHILVIPDLHAPYNHQDAIPFLEALARKYSFDRVVCLGDEIDGHAISFHEHDPDALAPGHELEAAIRKLEPLYKLFPEMDICESNHGSMVFRRAKHFGLPQSVLKPYGEVLGSPPGWKWNFEVNAQLSNGERVLFHHSYGANVLRVSQQRGVSVVQGHHHSQFGAWLWKNYEKQFFAAFVGCLADETSLALAYGRNSPHRPILGAMRIVHGLPVMEPMILDRHGRWVGHAISK